MKIDPDQRRYLHTWMSRIRRKIHEYPETAYEEIRTTGLIKDTLDQLGVETRTFGDLTGVVGLIRGKNQGPTLALRADIDALPLTEKTEKAYQSRVTGKMHACGHDSHTAIMLGVARLLCDNNDFSHLPGNVKFIFQPAEEDGAGAKKLIEQGVLKNPDVNWIISGHASSDLPTGTASFYHQQSHASSDHFILTIKGVGAHGARPHQGIDPFIATASFIHAVQSVVSRNVDPMETAVISIGQIHAGTTFNIIPDQVAVEGTFRALSPEIRILLKERIEQICKGLELSHDVTCELQILDGYPPCIGDEKVSTFMYNTAAELLGREKVSWSPPTTGGEDFAFYTQEVKGSICRMGCRNEDKGVVHPLHSSLFDIDEDMLIHGAEFFYNCVLRYFDPPSEY